MLSTVTYALSKKYADKAVEKAADVAADKAVDAAKEAVSQDMSEFSERLDSLEEDVDYGFDQLGEEKEYANTSVTYLLNRIKDFEDLRQCTDEKQEPTNTWSGKKYIFRNGVLTQVDDENYKCKRYRNLEVEENEWVFDAYCGDINVPVAILCPDWALEGYSREECMPIYAHKVGPVDKTILLNKSVVGYPPPIGNWVNSCTIILNSYQSEPVLYNHKFSEINAYTKAETDAAIGTVSQDVNECSDRIDTLEKDMSIIDKKADASNSFSEKRYGFSNNKLALIDDEDYECKLYYGYNIADNEWVFDAYCNDVNIPVAIVCREGGGDLQDNCIPIYATKVGPVNKTISITKEITGYPNDWCTIIVNSYQSEPTLYQHRLDVYTREGTDAAIANAINSAITNVINTAY
jgi:hypothetical protein